MRIIENFLALIVLGAIAYGCCYTLPKRDLNVYFDVDNQFGASREVKQDNKLNLLYNSVVQLRARTIADAEIASIATGFAINKELIMTAGHYCVNIVFGQVVGKLSDNVEMVFVNDNGELDSKDGLLIIALDEEKDLCVLRKEKHGLVPLEFIEDYDSLKIRDKVLVIGAPLGIFPVETEGFVVSPYGSDLSVLDLLNRLTISAPVMSGNSGGPVFNMDGKVIGMLILKLTNYDHVGVAVHQPMIRKFLNRELNYYGGK